MDSPAVTHARSITKGNTYIVYVLHAGLRLASRDAFLCALAFLGGRELATTAIVLLGLRLREALKAHGVVPQLGLQLAHVLLVARRLQEIDVVRKNALCATRGHQGSRSHLRLRRRF